MVFENFQGNPFWKQFYSDTERFAFEAEVTFLLQHFNYIKVASNQNGIFVCDFSLVLDRAYVDVTLRGEKRKVFLAVYDEVLRSLPQPNLLVHLRCGEHEELARIQRRSRAEERGIEIAYLRAINEAVGYHATEMRKEMEVLEIDSERINFATDEKNRREVADLIARALD